MEWFHQLICDKLQSDNWSRLMIFLPPQHGKSEIVSRLFPAWSLGRNPNLKIVGCSYSADLSSSFNRDVQRVIDTPRYHSTFTNTTLSGSNVRTNAQGSYLRNSDIFEVVGHKGFYKSVGVGGSLTGTPVDLAIIDDPIKDFREATSQLMRDRIWEWYSSVLQTRLHNNSRVVLMMTRWHEDDLAGRLLKKMEANEDSEQWDLICIPAIKEDESDTTDPRKVGEALWETKHNLKKLNQAKANSKRVFYALFQQKPRPEDGNMIKGFWFGEFDFMGLLEKSINTKPELIPHFFIDTAYTDDKDNDPSGGLCCMKIGNELFVLDYTEVWKELPDLVKYIQVWVNKNQYEKNKSKIYIEPKASGKSAAQTLKRNTMLNVVEYMPSNDSKIDRVAFVTPILESGRVYLLKNAPWKQNFIDSLEQFPNAKHDEAVDVLVMAINKLLVTGGEKTTWKTF